MKNYTITVNGTPYNVTVEEGAGAPVAAAPVAAPAAAPAPAPAARRRPGREPSRTPCGRRSPCSNRNLPTTYPCTRSFPILQIFSSSYCVCLLECSTILVFYIILRNYKLSAER